MVAYYWFYAILVFLAILIYAKNKPVEEQHKKICVVGFFALFLLLALRHPYMGVDLGWGYSKGYLHSFEVLNEYNLREIFQLKQHLNYERGYIIFNKLVGLISKDQQVFLSVCAFVSVLPIAIYTYKRSKMPLLSLFVFMGLPVFLIFFSGLRQAIAIGITVFSMFFVERKKIIGFVLTVLLATTFHSSSAIFLIAYPVYHIKLNNIGKLTILLFVPIVFVLREPLFLLFGKLFKKNVQIENTGAYTLFMVFVLIYIFLIVFNDNYERKNAETDKQNGLINLFYIACICQAFGSVYNTAIRVGYYFMVYLVIAIPNTLENFRYIKIRYNSYYTIIKMLIGAIFVAYGLYALKYDSWAMTNPYIFFWEY